MGINKNRISLYESNNQKFVKSNKVERVNMELLLTLNETTKLIQDKQCKDAVPYIIWNDFVNKNGTLTEKTNKTYNRYVWGEKVFVNFGMTNIQTELSYPHPAIVLYNFANTVIVVPTTSDDKIGAFSQDIEECIIKVKSDGKIFPKDSVINVHQICAIHKERILSDLGCNVKNYIVDNSELIRLNQYERYLLFRSGMNLLECINLKLSSLFNGANINAMLESEAYNLNEIYNLNKKIKKLEDKVKELEEKCKERS